MKKSNTKAFAPVDTFESGLLKKIVACVKNANWSWHHHISGGYLVSDSGKVILEFEDGETHDGALVSYCLMDGKRKWECFRGALSEFKAYAEAELVPACCSVT